MAFLKNLILATHFLGLAALIGGWLAMRFGASTLNLVAWGARIQLLTGILLVGVVEMGDLYEPNHMKIGVKLLIALGAVAAAEIAVSKAKKGDLRTTLVNAAGALGVLNVLVAALWKSYS